MVPDRVRASASGPLRGRFAALGVERLTVRRDRVSCDVAIALGAPRYASPALADRVRAAFPDVPRHACVNDEGETFAAVMDHTSLPHVLEHLVISLQARAEAARTGARAGRPYASEGGVVFVGTTEWTDESAGRARIEVSFADDLVALRAFRDAVAFLNAAVVPCSP